MSAPILIVGAGVAGLTCAIELHRAGRAVQLLDAAPEVGGRVRSTRIDGFTVDHGFQVLFTAYPTLRQYLDLDALALRRFQPAARIVHNGHTSLVGDALRDRGLLFDTVTARAIGLGDKLRLLALRRFAQQLSIDACFGAPYDRVSTRDFLQQRGFSTAAIDGFFAPFYGGILLDRTLATSASILLFTFKMLADGDSVVPAGGIGAITQQMAAQLPAGTVHVACRVDQILVDEGRASGVVLHDGTVRSAQHIVLATEAPVATRLAATAGVTLAQPTGARGCSTVYFTTHESPIPGKALWLNADPNAVISHAVTLTDVAPEYAPAGQQLIAATAVGDAATLSDAQLEAEARTELARMGHRSPESAALQRLTICRVPYAQYPQPPGWREHRPTIACGIPGLWRASEVLHSSSLEGAARGGVGAAQAILHST
jgi:phytoene dehydrogenase-like protein